MKSKNIAKTKSSHILQYFIIFRSELNSYLPDQGDFSEIWIN